MAFSRPRRRFFRRGGLGRRASLRWTGEGTTAANTTAAGTITTSDIIVPGDYQQQASLESGGVTLVRLRGNFGYYSATVGTIVGAMIIVRDDGEVIDFATSQNTPLTLGGDLINGQVLWRFSDIIAPANDAKRVEFDVRVKRKLQQSRVTLVVASYVNATIWAYSARALIRGG